MKFAAVVSAVVLGALSSAWAADTELVPLKLELPQPVYVPTPTRNDPAGITLEPRTDKPRPAMKVPAGLTNLAAKKNVTLSDDPIIGKPEQVTDGDKEAKDGSWVEMGPGLQYVQIDLEKSSEIFAIALWHIHVNQRVFRCVIVQLSDDPEFKKGVTTVFNNDQKNDSGLGVGKDLGYLESHEGKLVDAKGAKARYVRLYSKGNTSDDNNQMTEVEVWGR